jgi:hypothetical protein
MNEHATMIHMLRQLLKDMELVTSQGSGYYTCVPFARRFNKLLDVARRLFPADGGCVITTFDDMQELEPKDPGEKLKVLLGLRIEISQLIALLECAQKETGA